MGCGAFQGEGGSGGDGAGSGFGRGPGPGPKGEFNPDDPKTPQRATSPMSPGKIISSIQFKTLPSKGEAQTQYEATYREMRAEAAEALQQQEVPADYRLHVRDYFEAIRPDRKK